MTRVTEHLAAVTERIANAAGVAERDGDSVALLAVSKRHSADSIRAVAAAGQRAFGENYVDEGVAKIVELHELDLEWHFIGPIQSNKTKLIAEHFDWVHTVDRAKIVRRLSEQRPDSQAPLDTCIQVNIDAETQKAGASIDAVPEIAAMIEEAPGLRLRGLMCLPKIREDHERQREPFARLAHLFASLKVQHPEMDTLSMGMSGDLEAAIMEGATMVRVGTAIFGPRA
ncbi:MAG: YggS family pyridoxal phosphate-dependent enzyme [Pseudomonadota bacterium]